MVFVCFHISKQRDGQAEPGEASIYPNMRLGIPKAGLSCCWGGIAHTLRKPLSVDGILCV